MEATWRHVHVTRAVAMSMDAAGKRGSPEGGAPVSAKLGPVLVQFQHETPTTPPRASDRALSDDARPFAWDEVGETQPVPWEMLASLGLYQSTSPTQLRPSLSTRSQRSWSEFDGHPVSPLPSPSLVSPLDIDEHGPLASASTDGDDVSKTDAFFNSAGPLRSPQPPSSMVARSASAHVASTCAKPASPRQRAQSTPSPPSPPPLDTKKLLPPRGAASTFDRPFTSLPIERKRSRTTSRHVHGPSISMTNESITPHTELTPPAPLTDRESVSMVVGQEVSAIQDSDRLLRSVDPPSEQEDEEEGLVGPYRVVRRLGTGAFSKVVLAEPRDPAKQGRVAIKMIAFEPWKVDKRIRVSWIREAEVLKRISHPSVVGFLHAFRTPLHYALVLDAVDGGEMFELLSKYQPQLAEREWLVRRLFGELAGAVGWMHSQHLVHRDIKLENIMMTRTLFGPDAALVPSNLGPVPLLKITDFGLARFFHPHSLLETRCGSEEYAAPELIIGKKYDGRKTDAWALGVVLYALLTGGLPFLDDTNTILTTDAQRHSQDPPTREKQLHGEYAERDAKMRKAHLLRIAKGDLAWPERANDRSESQPGDSYDKALRLVTPCARNVAARYLRRDPLLRANCWDLWDDPWFLYGSFASSHDTQPSPAPDDDSTMLCAAAEDSAQRQLVPLPYNPGGARGQQWMQACHVARTEPPT